MLHHVSDGEPTITRQLLRAACAARGITFVDHRARHVDWSSLTPCRPGDLLHRSASSLTAMLVERYLWQEGVASVGVAGLGGADPWPLLTAERAGVPVVAERPCGSGDRGVIRRTVSMVGGLPVVVKVPGHQGGIGVMLAESWPALFGLLDHLRSSGMLPSVSRFVPDATNWRCVVVGDQVVAAHATEIAADDFRSSAPVDPGPPGAEPDDLRTVAVAATRAMGLAFAGVDLVVDAAGAPWVLEANSPCFFAPSEAATGVDIAGALVEHLLHRRR